MEINVKDNEKQKKPQRFVCVWIIEKLQRTLRC